MPRTWRGIGLDQRLEAIHTMYLYAWTFLHIFNSTVFNLTPFISTM